MPALILPLALIAMAIALLIFCEFEDWLDKVLGNPEGETNE